MKNALSFVLLLGCLYSCVPHKRIIYFQKNHEVNDDTIPIFKVQYKIQTKDVLSVSVTSFNAQVSEFYNLKNENKLGGYLVNDSGYIHMPMLDSLYVKDLNLLQIQELIKSKIAEQVVNPYVLVDIANFKFIALGEFGGKGVIRVAQNELTIIEAIALAGDISDFGNKSHIKLIRKVGDKNIFVTLNVNNRDIMKSEYFYIQPNDVLYAEPLKVKTFRTNVQQVMTYFGLVSFAFVFYTYIKSLK